MTKAVGSGVRIRDTNRVVFWDWRIRVIDLFPVGKVVNSS